MKRMTKKNTIKSSIASYFTTKRVIEIIVFLLATAVAGFIVELLARLIWR